MMPTVPEELRGYYLKWIESVLNKDGPVPEGAPELGPCWEWTRAALKSGYGVLRVGRGGNMLVHRAIWESAYGPIPEGLRVLHHCDHPPCARIDHLFLGTAKDNTDDALKKGRMSRGPSHSEKVRANAPRGNDHYSRRRPELMKRGDNHPNRLHPERMARGDRQGLRLHPERAARGERQGRASVTNVQAEAIRQRFAEGKESQRRIALDLGLNVNVVNRIIRGITYTE